MINFSLLAAFLIIHTYNCLWWKHFSMWAQIGICFPQFERFFIYYLTKKKGLQNRHKVNIILFSLFKTIYLFVQNFIANEKKLLEHSTKVSIICFSQFENFLPICPKHCWQRKGKFKRQIQRPEIYFLLFETLFIYSLAGE